MKKIVLILCCNLYAFAISFHMVSMDFSQTIVNELGEKITYEGKVYIDKNKIFWKYEKPVVKKIYIKNQRVVIIEPEIYQATFLKKEEGINLGKIYKKSKKVGKNRREVVVDEVLMKLYEDDSFITKIAFTDKLDNNVLITFRNIKFGDFKLSIFSPKIPKDYDILRR